MDNKSTRISLKKNKKKKQINKWEDDDGKRKHVKFSFLLVVFLFFSIFFHPRTRNSGVQQESLADMAWYWRGGKLVVLDDMLMIINRSIEHKNLIFQNFTITPTYIHTFTLYSWYVNMYAKPGKTYRDLWKTEFAIKKQIKNSKRLTKQPLNECLNNNKTHTCNTVTTTTMPALNANFNFQAS